MEPARQISIMIMYGICNRSLKGIMVHNSWIVALFVSLNVSSDKSSLCYEKLAQPGLLRFRQLTITLVAPAAMAYGPPMLIICQIDLKI